MENEFKPISTAVISHGISARTFHIPFILTHQGFYLHTVMERNGNTAAEKYPWIQTASNIDDVIEDPEIELVVICSPNTTHYPYARAAMLAGKHVIVEKPFTNTVAEARDLIAIATNTKKVCAVYHNRRYVADFLTMKKIIEEGLIGEPREFFAHYDRYRPDPRTYGLWREEPLPGSGIFYDLGPHLIDQALVLFGTPSFIRADIRSMKSYSKVDDYFDVRLEYDNLIVTLHASMLVREMGPRYMIHGTKGSFIKSGEDPQEEQLKSGKLPNTSDWGKEPMENFGLLHTELEGRIVRKKLPSLQGGYHLFYENIFNAIRKGNPLNETPEDGYRVINIIEHALEASKKGCRIPLSP